MTELLQDPTPILTLPPDEPEEELTEEEQLIKEQKIKVHKAKVIALHQLGHHPITTDIRTFNPKTKKQILELVKEIYDKPDDVIQREFNEICIEVVFNDDNTGKCIDYTTFPVFKRDFKTNNN
jgi:hypothetical protein